MMQEFVQRLQEMNAGAINGIHTAIPGTVVSFNPSTGMAVVTPNIQFKKPDGTALAYPNVSGVPVIFPQGDGQQISITYPVKPGDGCLLIVSEQALDYWMYQRETSSELRFDLTNSIAIVGLFAKAGPGVRKACDEDAVVIKNNSTTLIVKKDGVIIDGNLTVNGRVNASADVVAGSISLQNHTHAVPQGGESSPPH